MGRLGEARKRLEAALGEMRELSAGPAMDVQALRSLSMTLSFLAVARGRAGERPARVDALVGEAVELNGQAQKWDPDNAKVREEGALIGRNAEFSGVRLAGAGH
jgi:hypothetical protein